MSRESNADPSRCEPLRAQGLDDITVLLCLYFSRRCMETYQPVHQAPTD